MHEPSGLSFLPQKKATDPSRFNNRGGNLLKEEKQRADLQKSLPKVRLHLNALLAFKMACFEMLALL